MNQCPISKNAGEDKGTKFSHGAPGTEACRPPAATVAVFVWPPKGGEPKADGRSMRAKDLKPGKTPGEWTAEELKPQLLPHTWQEFQDYFSLYLRKQPDYGFTANDLDVFFIITGA